MESVPPDLPISTDILPEDVWRNICMVSSMEQIFIIALLSRKHRRITYENLIWKDRAKSVFGAMDALVDNYRLYFLRRWMFDKVWLAASMHGKQAIKLTKGAHWSATNLPSAHTEGVHSVDSWGWMIASGAADSKIGVYERNSKRLMYRLEGHSGAVKCVRINRYTNFGESTLFPTIGSCSLDKTVRIWKTESDEHLRLGEHRLVATLRGHIEKCMSMDWLPFNQVISGGWDKQLILWDVTKEKSSRKFPNTSITTCVTAHADMVVASSRDKHLRVFDIRTASTSPVMMLKGHSEPVLCHRFDEFKVVSGGEDKMVRWWDTRKGNQVTACSLHDKVSSLMFDQSMLVAGTWNGTIMFFSMQDQKLVTSLKDHASSVESIALNRLNIITGSLDKTVKMWNVHRVPPSVVVVM